MKGVFAMSYVLPFLLAAGCVSPENGCSKNENSVCPTVKKFVYRTDAPALRFPAIVPIFAEKDPSLPQTTALIQHLYHTAGLTEFAIIFPLNPQGVDPYVKPKLFAERFAGLKKIITNPEIKIGILVQATIGHGAVWSKNPNLTLSWQRTVNSKNLPSIRFCPLDMNFRKYVKNAVAGLFVSKPDFVIFDDDIRLHLSASFECFCPLHVEYFNRKYRTNYTPDELRNAVLAAPGGSKLLRDFAEARFETLDDFVKIIRTELDKYVPDARGIYCTVGSNLADMGRLTQTAAGKNISAMRIGNGLYQEKEVRAIVHRFAGAAIQIATHRDNIDELLDESDTCPHNLFSKTAHTMNLHIIMGLLHGLDGGKLWVVNNRYFSLGPTIKYPQVLGKNQGLYRELHRTLNGVKWHGGLQSVPPVGRDSHPEIAGDFYRIISWQGWLTGFFGLPHCTEKAEVSGIHLLSGNQVNSFTDQEIKRFLAEGAILDATAALNLERRNFAHLTGVKPQEITERITGGEWMEGMNFPVALFGPVQYKLAAADSKRPPRVLSQFFAQAFSYAEERTKVCDGAVIFENELGGKVVTVPFVMVDSRIGIVPERKEYMKKIFDMMGILPAWSPEPFDVFFRFGTLANGKQDIAAVCNISYEPMEKVLIGVKKVPAKIEKLAPDGGWDKCEFSVSSNIIEINDQLPCAAAGIYKFHY